MKFFRNTHIPLGSAVVLFLAAGLILGGGNFKTATGKNVYDQLKIFSEVLSLVKSSYVDTVDPEKLIHGAIDGMLEELDPHTTFMTEDMFKEMQVDTKGEFGGLGITISIQNDMLTVISPIEDTPAWRSGIEAGDYIMKVDGEPTKDMSISEAVKKMRGVPGTSVVLSIMRESFEEAKDFSIVRDIIKLKSVKYKVLDETVAYIRITSFQERTDSDLTAAIQSLWSDAPELKGLILDLRNNPGGLLDQAVRVSGRFLKKGTLVVYTKGRQSNNNAEFRVRREGGRLDFPMVVLVNIGSASASEIVAGALQDWDRAIILGTSTFGKGSVQTIIPLENGSGLRLTTARYFTPKGRSIQNTGILPDIEVKSATVTLKETDSSQHRKEKDLKGHLLNDSAPQGETDETPAKRTTEDLQEDYPLKRALDLLKSWDIFQKTRMTNTARTDRSR